MKSYDPHETKILDHFEEYLQESVIEEYRNNPHVREMFTGCFDFVNRVIAEFKTDHEMKETRDVTKVR